MSAAFDVVDHIQQLELDVGRGEWLEPSAVDVGDWYAPWCGSCFTRYARVLRLDTIDREIIRFIADRVTPDHWYDGRVETTKTEMRVECGPGGSTVTKNGEVKPRMLGKDTLDRHLATLENQGLIEQGWTPGHGGWIELVHLAYLFQLPDRVREGRRRLRRSRRRAREQIRTDRQILRLDDGTEFITEHVEHDIVTDEETIALGEGEC